ncbi:TIGR00341 family protein [Hydrogenovibrio kuenenii]|uniref:TIGR00341 family protein n=1 Tax=Hydrogenovibrio kuenenii TaxID=63658 RepID=UPI0004663D45|nr:TIGR00341 family protein [Hydrogenovibrio kuenenii]
MAEQACNYTVVFDADKQAEFEETILPSLADWDVELQPLQAEASPDFSFAEDSRILTWLGDVQLGKLLSLAAEQSWQVGFLPHPEMLRFYRTFPIHKKLPDALADIQAATNEACLADLMTCNGQLVFGSVMLGNRETMAPAAQVDLGFFSKIKNLFILTFNLSHAHLNPYCLETAKQNTINTAALGVAVVYRPSDSDFTKSIVDEMPQDEPMLNAIVLAPRSISEVVRFLIGRIFPKPKKSNSLPSYLGAVKTDKLTVSGSQQLDFYLNGEMQAAEKLEIEVRPNALKLLTKALPEKNNQGDLKESLRVSGLPKGQAVEELVKYPLPWIHHTDLEEVKETFVTLKENAKLSETFLVLMVLSTLLATVGLFANSAPVIIGAMILAPLMAPIISFSMGLLRQDSDILITSSKTLVTGILLALGFGTVLTLLTPLHAMNHEISTRLSPTILDLAVAIFSGIAGAYANARSEVAKSMAGVAIAVALVPPLAVSGIGIGWHDFAVFYGAFLLFVTNLVGIILAAALTFLLMGYSPFRLAKKGMILIFLFGILVSIPLGVSFHKMVLEQRMVYALEGWTVDGVEVRNVKVRDVSGDNPDFVGVTLVSHKTLSSGDIDRIKKQMEQKLGHAISLEATLAVKR